MTEKKPKLIVLSEQLRGQSFELGEDKYIAGRRDDCDITLPDPTISSHHCSFIKDQESGTGYKVVDEGSTNGTRVNGTKINSQKLHNSDIVQAGAIEMLYDSEEKDSGSSTRTKTGIELDSSTGTATMTETPNFSPFAKKENGKDKEKIFNTVLKVAIGGLVVAVAFVLGKIIISLLTS